jgi:hypothetical protein
MVLGLDADAISTPFERPKWLVALLVGGLVVVIVSVIIAVLQTRQ